LAVTKKRIDWPKRPDAIGPVSYAELSTNGIAR
jgi:hypothetical protein